MVKFATAKAIDISDADLPRALIGLGTQNNSQQPAFLDWVKLAGTRTESYGYYTEEEVNPATGLPTLPLNGTDTFYRLMLREGGDAAGSLDQNMTLLFTDCTIVVAAGATNVITVAPGHITFDYAYANSGGTLNISVYPSSGDHTIAAIPTSDVASWEAGAIFNAETSAYDGQFAGARFMDWLETNSSTKEGMSDYPTWDRNRVLDVISPRMCAEYMKHLGGHGWFCIPHLFTDTAVADFAQELIDNIPTGKKIFVEFSNELWNAGFSQAKFWVNPGALAEWGLSTPAARFSWYARRSTQVMQIVRSTFAAAGRSHDLRTVLGVQTLPTAEYASYASEAPTWLANDPEGYVAPYTVHDYMAVTGYFGAGPYIFETHGQEIIDDLYDNGQASAEALFLDYLADMVPPMLNTFIINQTYAASKGMQLIMYEGQQHIDLDSRRFGNNNSPFWQSTLGVDGVGTDFTVGEFVLVNDTFLMKVLDTGADFIKVSSAASMGVGQSIVGQTSAASQLITSFSEQVAAPGVDDLMAAVLWSQEMSDMQNTVRDYWVSAGGTYFNQFVNFAKYSTRGNWGTRRFLAHTNPVSTDLETWNTSAPRKFLL